MRRHRGRCCRADGQGHRLAVFGMPLSAQSCHYAVFLFHVRSFSSTVAGMLAAIPRPLWQRLPHLPFSHGPACCGVCARESTPPWSSCERRPRRKSLGPIHGAAAASLSLLEIIISLDIQGEVVALRNLTCVSILIPCQARIHRPLDFADTARALSASSILARAFQLCTTRQEHA